MRNATLQNIVEYYKRAGQPWPASSHAIAAWAIREGLWQPKESDLIGQCADQISRAMREEYVTDPQGRSVRKNHAATVKKNGTQTVLWGDIYSSAPEHMQIAFQQRRNGIVLDCKQLKTDVDSYNENWNKSGKQVNLVLDFTWDVAELEEADKLRSEKRSRAVA